MFASSLSELVVKDEFSQIIDEINSCSGKIITVGMGKAGIAMRKFSATLCSLGIPSCYLHPGEASHGDLGIIQPNDIIFVASTSGKTREVIETITLSRKINSQKILGITSHLDSPLRNIVDIVLDMGIMEEAGNMKLAPTTSILVMSALTDAIAIVLADERCFSKDDFSRYHHSGYLGQQSRCDGVIY